MVKKVKQVKTTIRIDSDLHEWLVGKESMTDTINQALQEMKYREENKDPYATGYKDGFEAGKKEKE